MYDPVSPEVMEYISPNNTICETLREIYNATTDENIKYKCRVATAMAKAMMKRLAELQPDIRLWERKQTS